MATNGTRPHQFKFFSSKRKFGTSFNQFSLINLQYIFFNLVGNYLGWPYLTLQSAIHITPTYTFYLTHTIYIPHTIHILSFPYNIHFTYELFFTYQIQTEFSHTIYKTHTHTLHVNKTKRNWFLQHTFILLKHVKS